MCFPDDHPAWRDIVRADPFIPGLPLSVWPAAVHAWQRTLGVPDIRNTDLFPSLDRTCREARRAAASAYKLRFLTPAIAAFEEEDWWAPQRARNAVGEWEYLGYEDPGRVWALDLAGEAGHPRFWRWYAAWVVARISGRIPLGAVSDHASAPVLPTCPSCAKESADLGHLLADCPGTSLLREEAGLGGFSGEWSSLRAALFGPCSSPSERARHVRLVGKIADALCGRPS